VVEVGLEDRTALEKRLMGERKGPVVKAVIIKPG
jgi:hypothetical protein